MNIGFDLTVTVGVIVTVALAVVGWIQQRSKTIDKRIDGCHGRIDRHENRLTAVESSLRELPGKEDLHGLSLSMAEMRGDMRELRASMDGHRQILSRVESVVSRQEDHLMRKN
ncbi:DUF2730 family protein [Paracoccus sp. (in: a-proteobacteria)]|uniref:DUF2730 family protein n=1 Tax=Paracoccus sp. TaxID=267 RepID=UPI0028B07C44|nr:DUF2730 family protein [Paracoccus sp. (in: a-proteobacteria)]